jgi:hypothetical protein
MVKIPDDALKAAARGLARYSCEQWDSDPERFWPHFADQARAAIAAALNAWPGMDVERFMPDSGPYTIHLPLPQAARDE